MILATLCRNLEALEEGVRERMQAADGYPFSDIIKEFQQKLTRPSVKVKWRRPQFSELVVSFLMNPFDEFNKCPDLDAKIPAPPTP